MRRVAICRSLRFSLSSSDDNKRDVVGTRMLCMLRSMRRARRAGARRNLPHSRLGADWTRPPSKRVRVAGRGVRRGAQIDANTRDRDLSRIQGALIVAAIAKANAYLESDSTMKRIVPGKQSLSFYRRFNWNLLRIRRFQRIAPNFSL